MAKLQQYWFARRFPVGHPRKVMAPVSREGQLVVFAFVTVLIVAATVGLLLAANGAPVYGIAAFAVIALIAGAVFIALANRKCDHQRTVTDYRGQSPGSGA
ncbi:MAG: hypothetical protein ACRECX_01300 [Methyloceanibacter sp.]|uniref:hypothetical protein n=1 Tax=Methyloceanibacter sp. TaxID=1965321 RepID=UPI003D6D3130